jgi:hypothetical protein
MSKRPAPRSTCVTRRSRRSTKGTTGIQANDLIGRKMAREGGATLKALIASMRALDAELWPGGGTSRGHSQSLHGRRRRPGSAGEWLVATYGNDVRAASASAVPFLTLLGIVAGGWQMARAALIAQAKIDAGDA